MITTGWIKLFRKTLESDFWLIDDPFSYRDAFFHILISANWTDGITTKNGHVIKIRRGQFLTSTRKLGEIFHWDRKKVYKWLKFMKETEMITSESVGFGTVLTVVNYDKYQNDGSTVPPTPTPTVAPTVTTIPTPKVATRYKNIEGQNEESLSAPAEPPEPPIGSPEWYKLHYDDD